MEFLNVFFTIVIMMWVFVYFTFTFLFMNRLVGCHPWSAMSDANISRLPLSGWNMAAKNKIPKCTNLCFCLSCRIIDLQSCTSDSNKGVSDLGSMCSDGLVFMDPQFPPLVSLVYTQLYQSQHPMCVFICLIQKQNTWLVLSYCMQLTGKGMTLSSCKVL